MLTSSKPTWKLAIVALVVLGLLAWKLRFDNGQEPDALDLGAGGAQVLSGEEAELEARSVESAGLMDQTPSVAPRSSGEAAKPTAKVDSTGCTLRGRVVDWDGEPVDWFLISAFDPNRILPSVSTQFSEPTGEFSIPHLAPGVWVVRAIGSQGSISVRVKVTLPDDPFIELICAADARISGVVHHPSGVGLAGVEVSFGDYETGDQVVTLSGEGGTFLLKELPGNGGLIGARFGDLVLPEPLVFDSLPGTQAQDVQLHLVLGGKLTGLVLDPDGKVEPATTVEVQRVPLSDLRKAVCDAEGKFELPPLPPNLYLVQVVEPTPGVRRRSALVDVLAGETTHVVLQSKVDEPVFVHGTVTLRGDPMAGEVFAFPYGDDLSIGGVRSGPIQEGRFELQLPHPGSYLLRTHTASGRTSPFVVNVPSQKSWDVHLELPEGRISGTLTSAQGEPAGQRTVVLESVGDHNRFSIQSIVKSGYGITHAFRGSTDDTGRWSFDGLSAGEYTVQAQGAGWKQEALATSAQQTGLHLPEGGRIQDIALTLRQGGIVWFKVTDARGQLVNDAVIFIRDADGDWVNPVSVTSTFMEGKGAITDLAPGTYTFMARTRLGLSQESQPVELPHVPADRSPHDTAITVPLQVATGVPLTVTITDANGQPAEAQFTIRDSLGRKVSGTTSFHDRARAAEKGNTFGVAWTNPLLPGTYELTAVAKDGAQATSQVQLQEASVSITLTLAPLSD